MPIIVAAPAGGEQLIFDAAGSAPDGSDPGVALQIAEGTNYDLIAHGYPAPELDVLYASSVDLEGDVDVSRRFRNRQLRIELDVNGDGALYDLQAKVAKIMREGGTLKRTLRDASTVRIYDLIAAEGYDPAFDVTYYLGSVARVALTFSARPLARGATTTQADHVETTLPALIASETDLAGDVRITGRLVVDNDSTVDWAGVAWGAERSGAYTFTDSTGAGGLYYPAAGRTPLSGAATATGATGATGTAPNVIRHTSLGTEYQPILSTQTTGAGAQLAHVGTFRVFARVLVPATNTGTVSIGLQWTVGDFVNVNTNTLRAIDSLYEGTWRRVDLGLVDLQKTSGSHSWEGRIIAKSTVTGDDVEVNWLELFPGGEGYGEADTPARLTTPNAFTLRDEFAQTAGALNAKVLPVGGSWVTSGSATDYQVNGTGGVTRTTSLDAGPRYAIAGSGTLTNLEASLDWSRSANDASAGLITRWTNSSNYLRVTTSGSSSLTITKVVAGTPTDLAAVDVDQAAPGSNGRYRIRVDANGRVTVWAGVPGGTLTLLLRAVDSVLATGGTLATGNVGLYDFSGTSLTLRSYDNVWAAPYVPDAALFAGQSLEVQTGAIVRESATGTVWGTPASYRGDHLHWSPAGAEARTLRYMVAPVYHPEDRNSRGFGARTWLDDRTDDISARLTYVARYL